MAITAQDVANYLIANPGLSDAQIASLANQYGVSAQTLSEATGVPTAAIEQRAVAAGAPLTGGGMLTAPTTQPTAAATGVPPVNAVAANIDQFLRNNPRATDAEIAAAINLFRGPLSVQQVVAEVAAVTRKPVEEIQQRYDNAMEARPTDYTGSVPANVKAALESDKLTKEQYNTLANYFGNDMVLSEQARADWAGTEAPTAKNFIGRTTGADFAAFLGTRFEQHGGDPATATAAYRQLIAPYQGKEVEYRQDDQGNYFVKDPITGKETQVQQTGPNQFTAGLATLAGSGQFEAGGFALSNKYNFDPATGKATFAAPDIQYVPPSESGFKRFASVALPIALMATGIGSTLGAALAPTLSSAAQLSLGNALVSGLSTGVITGDVEKGLIAGALAGAGTYVTQSGTLGEIFDSLNLGDYKDAFGIVGGNTSEAAMAATDASRLAAQGLSENQIAEILLQQSGITNPEVIKAATRLASLGVPQEQITKTLNDIIKTTPAPVSSIGGSFDIAGNPDILGGTSAGLFGGTAAGTVTGAVTGATTGAATGATTGAATGAATSLGTGLLTNAGQGLLNTLTKPETLQGLLNAGIDYATAERIANQMREEAAGIQQQAANIGQQAQVPFTPYTLTTGTGTSTVGPTGATAMLSPELQALQRQQIGLAGQTLGAINPAQAAQTLYGQAEALAAPGREREQERLLSTLGARGLLGIGRNLPTVGGEVRGVNPYIESLLSAQETARAQQALQATQFGTSEALRQQQLAQGLQTGALNLDTQAMNQLAAARSGQGLSQAQANRNAALLAEAQLKGLGYQIPLLESAASIQAGQTRGLGTAGQRLSSGLFSELFGGTPLSNLTYNGQTWGGTVENPWYG